jgi:DNA-3-methyladenine glycosylase
VAARLPRSFYARSALRVAPDLLGQVLVRALPGGIRLAARIVEAEAYLPGDPASHAYNGLTGRNAVMFGPPGRLYVYFTYGHHWMMNAVTGAEGEGTAVLLRAAEPLEGLHEMAARREREDPHALCSGPGKLAKAYGVTREQNGEDLVRGRVVWIERGDRVARGRIARGPRVGVSVGYDKPWRFWEDTNPFVSAGRPGPAPPKRGASLRSTGPSRR